MEKFENDVPTSGLEFELVEEICKVLNKRCNWMTMEPGFHVGPVPTIIQDLDKGNYDLAIAFMRGTKERMYAAKASAPYLQTRVTVYGLNNSLSKAMKNIKGAPILPNRPVKYAVVGAYEKSVREFLYPNNKTAYEVVKVESDKEVIEMLKSGQVDATITSELKTNYANNLEFFAHFIGNKNEQWGPRMYVANKNIKLMRDINKALKVLIDNGTYDNILKKYGSTGREACFQGEDDDATINIVADYDKCKK
jgi:ABC-type amino acid transport substrate-binding protein